MQEDDADRASRHLVQPGVERLDLGCGLGVDRTQGGLAEVGKAPWGESSDETLAADDADLEPVDLASRGLAIEQADAGLAKARRYLPRPPAVPVVIAQHGEGRDGGARGRQREDLRLLQRPVAGQVAREQRQIYPVVGTGNGFKQRPSGHREGMKTDPEDELVEEQEAAAAAEAARIGGRSGMEGMDEAERAAAEHGGGEAEGFEEAEELLEEQASHGDTSVDPLDAAFEVEAEEEPAVHGEADAVESTETDADAGDTHRED